MPYVGVPDTDELEAAARMIAVVLSNFGCSAKEPWCLTVGFRDIEGDHNSNVSSYCHLRVYRNSRMTVKISEGALPYELDKFGDKTLFTPKYILQKHISTRE
jgi:hypothetical protein